MLNVNENASHKHGICKKLLRPFFFYKLKQDSSIWYCITGISLDTTECIIVLLVTCYRNVI